VLASEEARALQAAEEARALQAAEEARALQAAEEARALQAAEEARAQEEEEEEKETPHANKADDASFFGDLDFGDDDDNGDNGDDGDNSYNSDNKYGNHMFEFCKYKELLKVTQSDGRSIHKQHFMMILIVMLLHIRLSVMECAAVKAGAKTHLDYYYTTEKVFNSLFGTVFTTSIVSSMNR
jgi:hypothetical protein